MGSTSWLGKALLLAALATFGCAQAATGASGGHHDLGTGVGGGGGGENDDLALADLAVFADSGGIPTHDLAGQPFCYPPRNGELCPDAIFVSPAGDDTKDGKSPGDAVQHINMGITRSLACYPNTCVILVAVGNYQEQVTLHENISILGGYSADFVNNDPVANVVNITSTETKTVIASGLTVPTKLDGVTITGASLTSNDGSSSYGLFVSNSHSSLTISRTVIIGGTGATGTAGTPGGALDCGTVGASGGTAFDCGGSTGGFGTSAGDATSGGSAGTGGSSNCPDACPSVGSDSITDGSNGTPGGSGGNGSGGSAPSDVFGSFASGAWQGTVGSGGTRGFNGTGGGGGGSGGTKRIRSCFGCGTLIGGRGGDGGPGGCGGGPGGPGGAGGGAFAAVLVDSEVVFDNVTVQGGTGGLGGVGGDGAAGQVGSIVVDNGRTGSASSKCGLINYYSGNGGHGGVGGNGGHGGGGGGGAGGPSVALVRLGSSAVTELHTVTVMPGAAGMGGAGGKGPGTAGASGPLGGLDTDRTY
jgi:hypothetical protein